MGRKQKRFMVMVLAACNSPMGRPSMSAKSIAVAVAGLLIARDCIAPSVGRADGEATTTIVVVGGSALLGGLVIVMAANATLTECQESGSFYDVGDYDEDKCSQNLTKSFWYGAGAGALFGVFMVGEIFKDHKPALLLKLENNFGLKSDFHVPIPEARPMLFRYQEAVRKDVRYTINLVSLEF